MKLKPEFADLRVCGYCGAPAAKLGKPWLRDGVEDWFAQPIELRCSPHTPGAEARMSEREVFGKVKQEPYHVRVISHHCIRGAGEDPAGNLSDDDKYAWECGCIPEAHTRRVTLEQADKRCFEDDGRLTR